MKASEPNFPDLDVLAEARAHVTDLGPVQRIDLNMLGADLGSLPAGDEAAWSHAQNVRLCAAIDAEMKRHGGGIDTIAEWTVAVNRHYDLADMRRVRTARWRRGFGSAITTLPWAHPASTKSVAIQTVGYVPTDPAAHFQVRAWQPACLYDASFLGLATATVVEIGTVSLIYLSGVVAWDKAIQPLAGEDPRAQVRCVLQMIQNVVCEAGGTPADVVRLRPFTASPEVARLLREESARLAAGQGGPEPTMLVAEQSSFWDAPALFTEIQAMGIVGRDGGKVAQENREVAGVTNATTRVRRTSTPIGTMWHAAELRAPAGLDAAGEAASIAGQVRRLMEACNLRAADVCLGVVYASSREGRAALTAALGKLVPPAALHAVFCPPMAELNGGGLKLEITAWSQP